MNLRSGIPQTPKDRVKHILALALPIMGAMFSQNLLNIVDSAMVGDLGPESLAAVGLSSSLFWICMSLFVGLSAAVQAITARRLGERRIEATREVLWPSVFFSLAMGCGFALLVEIALPYVLPLLTTDPTVSSLGHSYMTWRLAGLPFVMANFCFRGYWNGIGKSQNYLAAIIGTHGTNILLNYLLIYGHFGLPRMGVAGSGLATALAGTIGLGSHIVFALRQEHLRPILWRVRKIHLRPLLRLAFPTVLQQLSQSLGFLVFFRLASFLGTNELAISHVLVTLMLSCYLPGLGFGMAAATLVGKSLGEKEPQEAKRWAISTALLCSAFMGMLGLVLLSMPRYLLSFFTTDEALILLGILPLVLLGFLQVFDAFGVVLMNALLGAGDNKVVMFIGTSTHWLLYLPLAAGLLFFVQRELWVLWACFALYKLALAGFFALRFAHGSWQKKVV